MYGLNRSRVPPNTTRADIRTLGHLFSDGYSSLQIYNARFEKRLIIEIEEEDIKEIEPLCMIQNQTTLRMFQTDES